eukprot:4845541-Amphidinium_carterae.1
MNVESLLSSHSSLAQLVGRWSYEPQVVSSIPCACTYALLMHRELNSRPVAHKTTAQPQTRAETSESGHYFFATAQC